jgi:caffeoyl-CoA O-methyltransferase
MHNFFDLISYCERHTSPPSAILTELERTTHLRTLMPRMLSGPYQGRLLTMISQMLRPNRILEIGTFTGYSALCMAEGLAEDGILHTIEVNDEMEPLIREFIAKAGMIDNIRLHIGDAGVIIPTLGETFDLTFLDAGKLDYPKHFELALQHTRSGGFILADNVLWDGKVLEHSGNNDTTTAVLRNFNTMIQQHPLVDNLLLPLRDGLMLIRKH